jgi:hypothetical protein
MDDPLIEALLEGDATRSLEAAEALVARDGPAAAPWLLRSILRDCGWEHVPREKAALLGRLGGATLAEDLAARLAAVETPEDDAGDGIDEAWRTRSAYALALEAIGVAAVPALTRLLVDGPEDAVGPAARALGSVGGPDAVAALLDRLEAAAPGGDGGGSWVGAVLEALGRCGDPSAEAALIAWLGGGERGARMSAARALSGSSSAAARAALHTALLGDEERWVRRAAAEALVPQARGADLRALGRAASGDPEPRVRSAALRALAALAAAGPIAPDAWAALRALGQDTKAQAETRRAAVAARADVWLAAAPEAAPPLDPELEAALVGRAVDRWIEVMAGGSGHVASLSLEQLELVGRAPVEGGQRFGFRGTAARESEFEHPGEALASTPIEGEIELDARFRPLLDAEGRARARWGRPGGSD